MSRAIYAVLWLGLLAEAWFVAPDPRPDQASWLADLLTGQWGGEEPLVVGLFNLMGVVPFALGAVLAERLRGRPVPLWPFVLGSFALGAFVLLPGLMLAPTNSGPAPPTLPLDRWGRWLRSPAWLGTLALAAAGLAVWMALQGDGAWFWRAFQREQFVHLMTLDFTVLWIAAIVAARDQGGPWGLCVVPVFGSLAYAWRRGR